MMSISIVLNYSFACIHVAIILLITSYNSRQNMVQIYVTKLQERGSPDTGVPIASNYRTSNWSPGKAKYKTKITIKYINVINQLHPTVLRILH